VQVHERSRITTIDRKQAESLLYPIAAFLRSGGLTKRDSLRCFAVAFESSMNRKAWRPMEHIGNTTGYADIVATWTRDKQFLDRNGRPRSLRFDGSNAFKRLVQKAASGMDAGIALSVLVSYGNVRRRKDGRYELVKPFFFASNPTKMAFEPVASFLSDASSTLSRILKRRRNSRKPELFWRKVESASISDADAEKFNAFASERSLLFLEELEDWLEAHSHTKRRAKEGFRRIGLGMFSIYSDSKADR
jgi:hypothetical protein